VTTKEPRFKGIVFIGAWPAYDLSRASTTTWVHYSRETSEMPELSELIREYGELLDQEQYLSERKKSLRAAIVDEMARQDLKEIRNDHGSALRTSRFRLFPRRDPVLNLLSNEDIFPFANFTPARVKELLVPKYGRDTLIPLFEIEKTELLVIKRPPGIG
jgi:hypothetical protein